MALLPTRWRRDTAVYHYDTPPPDIVNPARRPAQLLRDAGFEVHIVSRGPERRRSEIDGTIAWVETGRAAATRRLLRLRPEFVFVEASSYGALYGLLSHRSWIRNPRRARGSWMAKVQRAALRSFDAVSITNPVEVEQWPVRPGQLIDFPYGFYLDWWSQRVERQASWWTSRGLRVPRGPVLACIAGLAPVKRQAELLEAVASLLRSRREVTLLFVGHAFDKQVAQRLERAREELDVADQVVLTGALSANEIRDLLAWVALTVVNSSSETQCLAVYESVAAGVPALLSAIPQLTSQFPSLPAHRNGRELLANVERLLADPSAGRACVEASRPQLARADFRRHDELFFATVERLLGRPIR